MGKLHTLRRAIERNPGVWEASGRHRRIGAYWSWMKEEWVPITRFYGPVPYGAFIEQVLAGVGKAEGGPGDERGIDCPADEGQTVP